MARTLNIENAKKFTLNMKQNTAEMITAQNSRNNQSKVTMNVNKRFLEGYILPNLLSSEEDYVFDELPNSNYCVGKTLETKWSYADIKLYVAKKGEQRGENSYFMKEFYFEKYLSDYASNLSDLLTFGKKIYNQIVKDITDYIVKNHPEFLVPETEEN